MNEIPEYIVQLFRKSFEEGLTDDERNEIEKWMCSHPGQVDEIKRLQKYIKAGRDISMFRNIDMQAAWKRLDKQTGVKRNRKPLLLYWCSAAAVAVVVIGMIWMNVPWKEPVSRTLLSSSESFKPGSGKAVWELSGGVTINLNRESDRDIVGANGVVLGRDSMSVLIVASTEGSKVEWSKIRVPQGGEYGVVLSDGTRVWINSESELRFPSVFKGKERVVEVKGEAYFDVTKDADHPFIVKTEHSAVRVLGTSFNICGYAEDGREQTTLVSGSVEVDYKGKAYKLVPGEQLEVSDGDQNEPVVKKVDIRLYTSWKDGMFRFVDMPLDELTVKLKRWYDMHFVFEDESCKAYRFSGAIRKDLDFNEFIQLIETTTDVKFEINGNEIVIKGR